MVKLPFSARSTQPTIAIRTTRKGDRCVLSVQDNGTGFVAQAAWPEDLGEFANRTRIICRATHMPIR